MTTGIIIQARCGSTRLPGKALMKIGEDTILEHVIDSCLSADVDWVIVATTSSPQNTAIIETVKNHNRFNEGFHDRPLLDIYVYDGEENNVLSRIYQCAKSFNLNTVIRITADCPLIQSSIINLCIKAFEYKKADVLDFMCIDGLEVQIINSKTLGDAHKNARFDYQREHVFPYMYEHPEKFKIIHLEDIKLSIDEKIDLYTARGICQR